MSPGRDDYGVDLEPFEEDEPKVPDKPIEPTPSQEDLTDVLDEIFGDD